MKRCSVSQCCQTVVVEVPILFYWGDWIQVVAGKMEKTKLPLDRTNRGTGEHSALNM